MAEKELPSNLKGYKLEKEGAMGLIKKLIILVIIVMALLYFFQRPLFDTVISYVTNLF